MLPLDLWPDLFTHLDVSVAEKVIRTIAVYLGIAVIIRLAGKRLLAQMNSLDLVVVLLLSNVVQNAIIGPDNSLLGGLIGAVVLVAFNDILDRLAQRFVGLRWLLEGKPTRVISNGVIDTAALDRLGLTQRDLSLALRRLGADHARQVHKASLEPGGDILLEIKDGQQAASKDDLAAAVRELTTLIAAKG